MRTPFSLMYAYRKTAVKAPCLASIKSNLPALRAAEHSFVVCPASRPMTLWRSKGPEPNSVHFIHTEACGLYYRSFSIEMLLFLSWSLYLSLSYCACIFLDSPPCPRDKLHSWILEKSQIFSAQSRACIILFINFWGNY